MNTVWVYRRCLLKHPEHIFAGHMHSLMLDVEPKTSVQQHLKIYITHKNVSNNKRALTARLRKPGQHLSRLRTFAGKQRSASLHSSSLRQLACLHQTTEL